VYRPVLKRDGITGSPPSRGWDLKLTHYRISATRRERIEAAVEAGGKHVAQPFEGWIAADPFRGGVRVLITGPQGFERTVMFARDGAAFYTILRGGNYNGTLS
jgi:hypothetical protein